MARLRVAAYDVAVLRWVGHRYEILGCIEVLGPKLLLSLQEGLAHKAGGYGNGLLAVRDEQFDGRPPGLQVAAVRLAVSH